MSLDAIYNALSASISGGQIDLYTASTTQAALNNLTSVLGLFGINAPWTLTSATLTRSTSDVSLGGLGTYSVGGGPSSNIAAILIGTSPNNANTFSLSLTVTDANWTFDRTFPALPSTQILTETRVIEYQDSFLIGLPLGKPVFSARNGEGQKLHLAGQLQPVGALVPWTDLFAPWPLRLDGVINALPATTTDYPDFDLTAISPSLHWRVLGVELRDVGLQLLSNNSLNQETWGRTGFSVLNVAASLRIGAGDNAITGQVTMPLLSASTTWRLMIVFTPGEATLTNGLTQLVGVLGIPPGLMLIPQGFDNFTGFFLSKVEMAIDPPAAGDFAPTVQNVAVTLASTKEWNPPIPFVRVRDVGTRWVVGWTPISGVSTHYLSGCVYGTVVIGGPPPPPEAVPMMRAALPLRLEDPNPNSFRVDINALIPQFVVAGALRTDDTIPIGQAFLYFFGGTGPATIENMAVTAFQFQADPLNQTYAASATVTINWTIQLGVNVSLTLVDLALRIDVTQSAVTGGITGQFILVGGAPPEMPQPVFNVGADYYGADSADGWVFAGALYPNTYVELISLVTNFLGIQNPTNLNINVEELSVSFATTSHKYALAGTVVGRWTPTLFGQELNISTRAGVDIACAGNNQPPEGSLLGQFSINSLSVTVGINLKASEPTYLLKVQFGDLWLSATTSWRGEGDGRHQVITLQLGGMTVSGILEYLVNLAAPTLGYHLETPWDVLNRIELSRFLLTIDPTENSVELVYQANANLIFVQIDTIGVRYRKTQGEPDVELILTGRFLNVTYGGRNPLAWNVISDPPPAVPGAGDSLLDLRYLGLGQRITLKPPIPDTVRDTVARLRADMKPPTNPNENPLQQSNMMFAADSEWLIGLDVKLLDTLDLAILFNDGYLYGLSIGLNGERAGSLSGLYFEILYKKITNDIGMFRIELQLPEAFRHIELGEVSITLGVIVVEIYTNGNFMVDLGFPYNNDFARSFTVQVFPFIGRGGIYFGLLNGSTSRRVPAITNGNFSPVVELGVGLAVGVGKEITVGPLSGGIYVEVLVIFQGVLGWFNPTSSSVAPAQYYWVQGVAGIHGKLYGKVDFVIIKVSVTIEAWAQASVTLEAYKATVFRLDVGVSVDAEVEFLFFSVSYSFNARLDVSFTVGSDQRTPWILAGGQGSTSQLRLRSNVLPAVSRRSQARKLTLRDEHLTRVRRERNIAAIAAAADEDPCALYALTWNPSLAVFTDSPRTKDFTMLPAFSITQLPVNWDGTTPANNNPQYRVAFLVFAPNGMNEGSESKRTAALSSTAGDTDELTADTLMEAFLRWSISAVTGSPGNNSSATVTSGQLALLREQMDCPQTVETAFSISNLSTFFRTNLWMTLRGDPGGSPPTVGGMVFPMPPFLSWTSPQADPMNFATQTAVGPLYEWGANAYMSRYFPLEEKATAPPSDDPANYESFATFLFRDWCLMVAKTAVQAAEDAMSGWTVTLESNASLANVASGFPTVAIAYTVRAGDTVDSVAAALGTSPEELVYLNPAIGTELAAATAGSTISVTLGVAPQSVATDNAAITLATNVTLNLGAIDYQAQSTDTLNGVATRFNLSGGAITLFNDPALADDLLLLNSASTFQTATVVYTPPAGFNAVLTAAAFYVRYYGRTGIPHAEWYAQTVFDFNASGALTPWDYNQPIPANTTLLVPPALDNTDPAQAIQYITLPGDTLTRIGAALSLNQNYATGTGPDTDWPRFRQQVTASGQGFSIPATIVALLSGETVNTLASRTIVYNGNLSGLLGWIGGAQILSPLALIPVPAVTAATGVDGANLADLATRFALTVPDLASRIPQAQIFAASGQTPLTLVVAHLAVQGTDALVSKVLGGDAPAQISGMCSRFLLGGLRLPAPVADGQGHKSATGALTSIYDLSGQQFAGPVPDGTKPADVALSLTVTVNQGTGWIQLSDSTVVVKGETLDSIATRLPAPATEASLRKRNPGVNGALPIGMILDVGDTTSLVFNYTNQQLTQDYPPTGLGVQPTRGPLPLSLAEQAPRTWGLDHRIELQSPIALPIPVQGTTPLTGNQSLWPFSTDLIQRAQAAGTTPYETITTPNGTDAKPQAETLASCTWATLLPFGLHRLEGREHVFELTGADTAARQVLLQLWQYIKANPSPVTQAFLLLAPAPNAGNPSGLGVLAADTALTWLLKTNETTDTAPNLRTPRAEGAGIGSQYYASFADLSDFLVLLWEGSVVGGAGYYFSFTASDGTDLPSSAFDESGNTTLYLLTIAGTQQALAPDGRTFLPFNNCAAVAAGLDASANTLYVEAADDSDLTAVAVIPAGELGFTFTLPQPQSPTAIQSLFGLSTFEIPATTGDPFVMPAAGFPVVPQEEDGLHLPLWKRARNARWRRAGRMIADNPQSIYWRFDQVLPVSRFGPASVAPASPALPDPLSDPYRGIGSSTLQQALIQLGFADPLGNVTAPPSLIGSSGAVTAPAGYTDAILGPSNWPATTSSFALSSANGQASLTVTIAPQPAAIAPAPGQSPATAITAASKQAEKYSQAFYQLIQPGVSASVLTSLKQDGNGAPVPISTPVMPLWYFVTASYVASSAAASVLPVKGTGTLAQVTTNNGISYTELAEANASQPTATLFGENQPLSVPAYTPFPASMSANDIVAATQPGWPKPASGAALLEMDENANVLPLRVNVVLSIPSTNVTVPPVTPPDPTIALDDLAASHGTSAALLAYDSAALTGILQTGFVFVMDALEVTVGDTVLTFNDVAAAFANIGVNATAGDIAAANGSRTDMLVAESTLHSLHYIAKLDETLAVNASGASVTDLATGNAATPNIFDDGASVYLGNFSPSPTTGSTLETLRAFADRYAVPPALLLSANPTFTLPSTTTLIVPGNVTIPNNGAGIWVPYTMANNDTLDGIVAKFVTAPGTGTAAVNLATANEYIPGVMAPGKTVTVTAGGTQYSTVTQSGDSFHSVLLRLQAQSSAVQLSDVVSAIESQLGYLAQFALLVCPAVRLAGSTPLTPAAASAPYGIDAPSFAQTNAGVLGIVTQSVTLWDTAHVASITTGATDTFNSIVSRFAAANVQISIPDIVSANATTAFLNSGALALLPPAPTTVTVSIGAGTGPFASPMFPLTATLRIQRPESVISPEFVTTNQDGPVERADSAVPAPVSPQSTDGGQSLTEFAAAFRAALPTLWLATGKVASMPGDLWVVDFGASGISNVTVAPSVPSGNGETWPRFIALRPLYNDLVNRLGVPTSTVNSDGTLSDPEPRDYQSVDVEVWARRFLADMDLFLTAPYATGVYDNAGARATLDTILDNKGTLAAAIPRGLMTVLQLTDPNATAGIARANEVLKQQLAVSLSSAYATAAIVQCDAAVASPWTAGQLLPARLAGSATAVSPGGTPPPPAPEGSFTLTNAKTDLAHTSSFVTFLMRVPNPAYYRQIDINLDYGFQNLEFDIQTVPGVGGYEASDWLAFVPQIAGATKPSSVHTSLGAASVPIPLRAYPPPPVLLGQSAGPSWKPNGQTTPPLASTPLWTYGLSWSHEHADQDEVLVTARFNVTPPSEVRALDIDPGDVATPLAQYNAVADQLWALLAGFSDPTLNVPASTLVNACQSFATLSTAIASAWRLKSWQSQVELADDAPAQQTYSFRVSVTWREEEGIAYLDTLTLVSEQARPGPVNQWPNALCRAADGTLVPLTPGTPSNNVLVYQFPETPAITAQQWPQFTLEWSGLNVAAIQNAVASISVRRNKKLLGPSGPDTNDGFVYQTAITDAPNIITPLLDWPQRVDITAMGTSVTAALQAVFTTLFGTTTGLPITAAVLYGYELVAPSQQDPEGLVTFLPVTLYPNQDLTSGTAAAIAGALTAWQGLNPTASEGGEWVFALTVYSQFDPNRKQPLLSLERLIYRL